MDQQLLVTLAAAIALSATLGILLGRYAWPSLSIAPDALDELRANVTRREQECEALRAQTHSLAAERGQIEERSLKFSHECAMLNERVNSLQTKIEHQSALLENAEAARVASQDRAQRDAGEIAGLIAREKHLAEKVEAQVAEVHGLNEKLAGQFENIATRILKSSSSQLSETSNQSIAALLNPLQDKIKEFQQTVQQTYQTEQREVVSLKEQIKLALEVSQNVGKQADDLAKALRGNSQQIGRWGELVLERILQDAGLREDHEYKTQGRGLQLKSDDGGTLKPDVIVYLPEGRSLVVDSKVPLANYERLVTTDDDGERAVCRGHFLRDVKRHIDDLAGKRYQENAQLVAHEFVLLFMPIESSLHEALTRDPNLFAYAWSKNVVLVGPSTLLATMRTVHSIWRYEKQAENAQNIARDAGLLLDKLSSSIGDFNQVGKKLSEAADAHNGALKRLFTGKGNALSIGDRIREAGVRAKLPPSPVLGGVAIGASQDDYGSTANDPEPENSPDDRLLASPVD